MSFASINNSQAEALPAMPPTEHQGKPSYKSYRQARNLSSDLEEISLTYPQEEVPEKAAWLQRKHAPVEHSFRGRTAYHTYSESFTRTKRVRRLITLSEFITILIPTSQVNSSTSFSISTNRIASQHRFATPFPQRPQLPLSPASNPMNRSPLPSLHKPAPPPRVYTKPTSHSPVARSPQPATTRSQPSSTPSSAILHL